MQIHVPHKNQRDRSELSWESVWKRSNFVLLSKLKSKKLTYTLQNHIIVPFKNQEYTLLQAEIGWWTIGCPAKGKRGFGIFSESGRNLVPVKSKNFAC